MMIAGVLLFFFCLSFICYWDFTKYTHLLIHIGAIPRKRELETHSTRMHNAHHHHQGNESRISHQFNKNKGTQNSAANFFYSKYVLQI